jgi:pimeloyl-ACP methyl ester carboxylesterase
MIDVGGRALRVVRAGVEHEGPLVVCEHGAFGCATDWTVVQDRLAARGLRSLAYDRAGLGHSDPGPSPRDARAMVSDLGALLARLGETGPRVVVGHSMGGLMARLYSQTYPKGVLGVVLVDAVVPEVLSLPAGAHGFNAFASLLKVATVAGQAGLMRPVALVSGNLIGLPPAAAAEKRRIHGSAAHARWAAEEVANWPATRAQVAAVSFPPDLPVAVVTAGTGLSKQWLKALQAAPALASRRGYVEHVAGASHANLLGLKFADPILRGVCHVLA